MGLLLAIHLRHTNNWGVTEYSLVLFSEILPKTTFTSAGRYLKRCHVTQITALSTLGYM